MHVDAVNGLAIWHSHPDTCINNIEKIRLFWWIDVDKKSRSKGLGWYEENQQQDGDEREGMKDKEREGENKVEEE